MPAHILKLKKSVALHTQHKTKGYSADAALCLLTKMAFVDALPFMLQSSASDSPKTFSLKQPTVLYKEWDIGLTDLLVTH